MQVTLTAGLTFAHLGTNAEVAAEVGNITRNVKIRGLSTSLSGYFYQTGATGDTVFHGVEFSFWGSSTALKRGVQFETVGATATVTSCTVHDCNTNNALGIVNISGAVTLTVDKCVFYSMGGFINCTVAGGYTITTNLGIGYNANGGMIVFGTGSETFTNNVSCCSASFSIQGIQIGPNSASTICNFVRANWSGNVVHHVGAVAAVTLAIAARYQGTLLSWRIWGNTSVGFRFQDNAGLDSGFTFESWNVFANQYGLSFNQNTIGSLTCLLCVFSGGSAGLGATPAQVAGILFAAAVGMDLVLESTTFGVASGVHVAHTTTDISYTIANADVRVKSANCILSASNPFVGLAGTATSTKQSNVRATRFGQTAGDHRSFFTMGKTTRDTTVFNVASPSLRLIPSSASIKFGPSVRHVQCNSGVAPVVSVYVRKSAVADAAYQGQAGADYNGAQPRMTVKRAVALGLTADTVIDTMTVGLGSWEQLSGALPTPTDDGVFEVYVDCDGTAGNVNIDDWTVA